SDVCSSDLNLPHLTDDQILFSKKTDFGLSSKLPITLLETIAKQSPVLKKQNNAVKLARQQWQLEKAQRIPDVTLQMNYDRGGNIMRDFVGVGFSIDLPVFNTNKAAAKAAQFAIEEQNMKFQAATSETEQQARRLKIQLVQYEKLLREWE